MTTRGLHIYKTILTVSQASREKLNCKVKEAKMDGLKVEPSRDTESWKHPFGKVKPFHHAEHLPHFSYSKLENTFVLYLKKAIKQKAKS